MTASIVILFPDANIATIGNLHDDISNTHSSVIGKWGFDCKIYRPNPASADTRTSDKINSTSLCTLEFKQHPENIYCVSDATCTTVTGDINAMLDTKLKSIWLLRQTLRGDGRSYDLNDGEYTLRTANVFLQGGYKGLLIQIDTKTDSTQNDAIILTKMQNLLATLNLMCTVDSLAHSDADLAKKYADLFQGKKL